MASAIGTTIGTPSIDEHARLDAVLVQQDHHEADADDHEPRTASHSRLIGRDRHSGACRRRAVVERRCASETRQMTTSITQPAQSGMLLFMMATTSGSCDAVRARRRRA